MLRPLTCVARITRWVTRRGLIVSTSSIDWRRLPASFRWNSPTSSWKLRRNVTAIGCWWTGEDIAVCSLRAKVNHSSFWPWPYFLSVSVSISLPRSFSFFMDLFFDRFSLAFLIDFISFLLCAIPHSTFDLIFTLSQRIPLVFRPCKGQLTGLSLSLSLSLYGFLWHILFLFEYLEK